MAPPNRTPKTMSVSEFKAKLSTIAKEIGDEPIIVASHGEPRLMVVSPERGEELLRMDNENRRQAILRKWEGIYADNQARNADLSDAEIEVLIETATRDVNSKVKKLIVSAKTA